MTLRFFLVGMLVASAIGVVGQMHHADVWKICAAGFIWASAQVLCVKLWERHRGQP